jgi:hypothetical protein
MKKYIYIAIGLIFLLSIGTNIFFLMGKGINITNNHYAISKSFANSYSGSSSHSESNTFINNVPTVKKRIEWSFITKNKLAIMGQFKKDWYWFLYRHNSETYRTAVLRGSVIVLDNLSAWRRAMLIPTAEGLLIPKK